MTDIAERLQNLIEADDDPAMVRFYKDCLTEIEKLRSCLHAQESVPALYAEIKQLREQSRAVLGHVTDLRAQLEKANTPMWDKRS